MKEEKNKSQKWIIILLSVIAVCLMCIIVLLATNISSSPNQKNNTSKKEAREQISDTQDKKEADEHFSDTQNKKDNNTNDNEEFINGYVTIKGEKHLLYVWNAELADKPITPTEITETWILDGFK